MCNLCFFLHRLSWRVVTERPGKKYMSKAARIVAGIGTRAGERWSVRHFGSEPQGKVQPIAADTHMVCCSLFVASLDEIKCTQRIIMALN